MKTLKLIVVLIFVSLDLYSQEINISEKVDLDSCLIESFINSNCNELNCNCKQESWEMKILHKSGDSFFHDFNKEEFENKTVKYIIENFLMKYKYLGGNTLNRYENHTPNAKFKRNTFHFYFKSNDSTLLFLFGCIDNKSAKIIENDSIALSYILEQNQYLINFSQQNVKMFLKSLDYEDIKEFESFNNFYWKLIKKHFHYLFPKAKRK